MVGETLMKKPVIHFALKDAGLPLVIMRRLKKAINSFCSFGA